jgi:hypothetical protein
MVFAVEVCKHISHVRSNVAAKCSVVDGTRSHKQNISNVLAPNMIAFWKRAIQANGLNVQRVFYAQLHVLANRAKHIGGPLVLLEEVQIQQPVGSVLRM